MRNFKFRGYEIHSSRMWQQAQVDLAMDFMVKHGMNALIFHQNDLVEQLVFPEAYFDNDTMWDNWPVRRQGVLYQRDYINQVIKKAQKLSDYRAAVQAMFASGRFVEDGFRNPAL